MVTTVAYFQQFILKKSFKSAPNVYFIFKRKVKWNPETAAHCGVSTTNYLCRSMVRNCEKCWSVFSKAQDVVLKRQFTVIDEENIQSSERFIHFLADDEELQ